MAFESLSDKLSAAFKKLRSKGKLTEQDIKEAMREVKMALLEADVSYKVVRDFVKSVSERAVGAEVMESLTPAQQVVKIVNDELCRLMGNENQRIRFASNPPTIMMMCGLQGAGKTTHAAKLAKYFMKQNHRPLLVACDVYRPAAIDQLKVVGSQVGAPVFEMGQGDPVKIAQAAIRHAKDYGNDIVIIDTAGRLHIDETLMDELKRIKAAVSPQEIMLVVDAMTGQDAVNVAESFHNALDIDSVLLTKLDGDTRGGAALSVLAVTGKPIKFVGMGEKLDEIEPFHPERMASRILGMGDVLTLIEKAQTALDDKKADEMLQKMKQNSFDMNDLLDQMHQIRNMGSMKQLLSMIPGVGAKIKDMDIDDRQLVYIEAMITSMTKEEREKPSIINPSRKRRIAAGSGRKVEDVNRLLKQFEQMQKMMKMMSGNMKGKKGRRMRMPNFPMQ
ncbi:signal recognition particle protein [Phocea massiliensis]|uniref:Signal recognition particle protein n=1 Tax=Merdimmobilis hominis TaxID=2897707 RepID=A0A938X590_9FIRM|nr:signal recognition particle protein [Merdimmobilis hominis]MBM6920030.1 signal recognition particle protein [Merdimmobilis hominis]